MLYGDVGYDITPKNVAEALKKSKAQTVNVRISSGGGSAFDGLAIYNLLRASGRRIEVDIDGLAASAASVIAMAGDEIRISEAALMMIHNSSADGTRGHAEDLRDTADVMDKIDQAIAATYARKSGRSAESFRSMMGEETWMTPQEALAAGLVDKITGAQAVAASVKSARSWAELPDEVKAKLQAPTAAAIVALVASSGAKEDMTPEQLAQALAAALAPFAARLDAIEASASAADSEEEPEVEVEESVESEQDADVKTMFDAAVSATFDRFVAAGKLAPAGREHFAAACATAAGFKAVCALYEGAPVIVATAPLALPTVKAAETRTYSAEALAWAERSKIDVTKLQGSK